MRGLLPRRRPRRPQEFRRVVRAQGPLWRTQSSPLWSLYALNTKYSGSANDAIPNPTASKLCQPFTSLGAVLRMCITQIPQQIDTNTTPIPARIVSSGPHRFSTPGRVKIPPAHPTDRTQRSQPVLMRRTLQPKVSTRLSASSITNVAATGNPRTTVAITKRPVVGDAIARVAERYRLRQGQVRPPRPHLLGSINTSTTGSSSRPASFSHPARPSP